MRILRTYSMPAAWYALIKGDDGVQTELKIERDASKQAEPSNEDWLTMAAIVLAKPAEPETTIDVECEDATIV